jgi:hypothetical protein
LEAATLYDENSRQLVHPQKVLLWIATFCILASPVRFLCAGLHCKTKSGRQWSRWISRRSYKNAKWWSPYTTIKERNSSLCLVQTAEKKSCTLVQALVVQEIWENERQRPTLVIRHTSTEIVQFLVHENSHGPEYH